MKKLILIMFIFTGCAVMTPLQKSKLIAAFHLIEIKNYEEAKKVVEEMIDDPTSSEWSKTWYARGVLCQTAYQDGIKTNDAKKYELYSNQLYVAYSSFERARMLDHSSRLERTLAPKYVLLANDFQKMGENHFRGGRYAEALRSFEQALKITQNSILAFEVDNNLMYNTAMAAYEAKDYEKAIHYFDKLNEANYSSNVLHLLFNTYIDKGDTLAAERILTDNINRYEDNEGLVLILADMMLKNNHSERAITVLDDAIEQDPEKHIFHYTKGLIYQKNGNYTEAIKSYKEAVQLAPNELMSYIQIATCYYNIGVEIEEASRAILNNRKVLEDKARADESYSSATSWLDMIYDKQPENREVNEILYQLYRSLSNIEKAREIQGRL